jgi:hypothetical protein
MFGLHVELAHVICFTSFADERLISMLLKQELIDWMIFSKDT